jgi:predicted methyltransferase
MRKIILGLSVLGLCALAACATTAPAANADTKAAIAAALSDAGRPDVDKGRDAARKPGEMLEFAGIGPGSKVAEYAPGGGYFTRIFAKAVGPTGKVYAATGPGREGAPPAVAAIAADPTYGGNIVVVPLGPNNTFAPPEKVDVVWTSRNYHDLGLSFGGNPPKDVNAFNKSIYDSLKPGGIYIVLDHSAGTTAAPDVYGPLHRINPNDVKTQVESVVFKFVGESAALKNAADNHSEKVFEQGIRDHTDQFILKFRKP